MLNTPDDRNYIPPDADRQLCYQHDGLDTPSDKMAVNCGRSLSGNSARIEMINKSTQLVLCDIKINIGRNVALRKTASYSEDNQQTSDPGAAVDGTTTTPCVFVTPINPWWEVDLGTKMKVNRIVISEYSTGYLSGYAVETAQVPGGNRTTVFTDNSGLTPTEIYTSVEARLIRISRSGGTLALCEVQVFAECPYLRWGNECENNCGQCLGNYCYDWNGYCKNGCKSGYKTTYTCLDDCDDGRFGAGCFGTCGHCLDGLPCNKRTGYCDQGCAPGWTADPTCIQECQDGNYGLNCTGDCSSKCDGVCNKTDGVCPACTSGWQGHFCEKECDNGTYGAGCIRNCSNCFNGEPCEKSTGVCINACSAGWQGEMCDRECEDGRYGNKCEHVCSQTCDGTCNKMFGECFACLNGWNGTFCEEECKDGTFGRECQEMCLNCFENDTCNKSTGKCPRSCQPGWQGYTCDQECADGSYGLACNQTCSKTCNGTCEKKLGICPDCNPGVSGDFCDEECLPGMYGARCKHKCGACGNRTTCHTASGICATDVCEPGYKITDKCHEVCDNGHFGHNCSHKCGNCEGVCNKANGHCEHGCIDGFEGEACVTQAQASGPGLVAAVGGSVGVVVVMAVLLVVVLVLYRRRRAKPLCSKDASGFTNLTDENEKRDDSNHGVTSLPLSEYVNDAIKKETGHNEDSPDVDSVYYNNEVIVRVEQCSKTKISLENFKEYLLQSSITLFMEQFQKLPSGLCHATHVASDPVHNGKNRYRGMYAYDHSRVVLKKLKGKPHTDYINACHINGYQRQNCYIAAQGPTEATMNDFCRMILEQRINTIVMVTNLSEEGRMKCLKYWTSEKNDQPENDAIVLALKHEQKYADFTIRRLRIYQEGHPDSTTDVTQFHYTAWPDKDVPNSPASLIHFWRRVRAHDEDKILPWLVHCSAGVGRTGTFIAMDVLYEAGKALGTVNIFECVKNLRDQRVNMVQTAGQYRYLHTLVKEMLVLANEPVSTENFAETYTIQGEVDVMKLQALYEMLQTDVTDVNTSLDERKNKADSQTANLPDNIEKNRYKEILASDEYRPFLNTPVAGTTNYINAIFIPDYINDNRFVISQTPLKTTVIDYLRLIHEHNIRLVIAFDDHGDEKVGSFVPTDDSPVVAAKFLVKKISETTRSYSVKRTYKMEYKETSSNFDHITCTKWTPKESVPANVDHMITLQSDVERALPTLGDTPILVQCLNGAERSGLFVVLINILERCRMDGEVSIPQVIRHLRTRRHQIIPNFAQFMFCYESVVSYMNDETTYANL
ncbi:receptor-type tyrosine-protein phosphatase kappa-like isoform X2 [Mya arenaria]|nr:receptor-type tyrosine-protein phosphatase kappa-like isoform X2 [Mya arenaria]